MNNLLNPHRAASDIRSLIYCFASAASGQPVTVSYATADGSDTAGLDYQAQTGSPIIAAGTTTSQISIPINSDQLVEPNETFSVTLTSSSGATLGKASATGTITGRPQSAPQGTIYLPLLRR